MATILCQLVKLPLGPRARTFPTGGGVMITTARKYARAMKMALDLELEHPVDYEAATSREPVVPDDGIDQVLDLLIPLLESNLALRDVRPLSGVSTCPTCKEDVEW